MSEADQEARALYEAMPELHRAFVTNLLCGQAKRQAWIMAGGSSASTSEIGTLLRSPRIARYLQICRDQQHDETIMTMQEMARRLTAVGRTHVDDLVELVEYVVPGVVDEDGEPVTQSAWRFRSEAARDPLAMGAVSELTLDKSGQPKIKLHSPLVAMKQLAELMGYDAPKRVEVGVATVTAPDTSDVDPKEAARLYQVMIEGKGSDE